MDRAREHIRWKLPDYLKQRGISVYALQKETAKEVSRNTVYRWGREGEVPKYIDLAVLVAVIRGLERLTGEEVAFDDILEYDPTPLRTDLDEESRTWLESDLSRLGEFEPYDWEEGEADEWEPSWRDLIGMFDDEGSPGDISARMDDYLNESMLREYEESTRGER